MFQMLYAVKGEVKTSLLYEAASLFMAQSEAERTLKNTALRSHRLTVKTKRYAI